MVLDAGPGREGLALVSRAYAPLRPVMVSVLKVAGMLLLQPSSSNVAMLEPR